MLLFWLFSLVKAMDILEGHVYEYLYFAATAGETNPHCISKPGGRWYTDTWVAFGRWTGDTLYHGTFRGQWPHEQIHPGSFYTNVKEYAWSHVLSGSYFKGSSVKAGSFDAVASQLNHPAVLEYSIQPSSQPDFLIACNLLMENFARLWKAAVDSPGVDQIWDKYSYYQNPDFPAAQFVPRNPPWAVPNPALLAPDNNGNPAMYLDEKPNIVAPKVWLESWDMFSPIRIRGVIQQRELVKADLAYLAMAQYSRELANGVAGNLQPYNGAHVRAGLAPFFADPELTPLYDEIILFGRPRYVQETAVVDPLADVTHKDDLSIKLEEWIAGCDPMPTSFQSGDAPNWHVDYQTFWPFGDDRDDDPVQTQEFLSMDLSELHNWNSMLIDAIRAQLPKKKLIQGKQAKDILEKFNALRSLIEESSLRSLTGGEIGQIRENAVSVLMYICEITKRHPYCHPANLNFGFREKTHHEMKGNAIEDEFSKKLDKHKTRVHHHK